MNPVTRKYMELLGRITINDRGNVNIVWHAGNKPRAEATHFIGSATGNQVQLNLNTASPDLKAKEVSDAMLLHVRNQCRVRLVNYRLLYQHYTAGLQTLFNGTNLSFVRTLGVPGEMGDITPTFGPNDDVSLQAFTDYYEKLYQRYVARYRNTVTQLTDTICHTACHSSCYGSRSRR